MGWGQVTIASQDFEVTPASPTMTFETVNIGSPGSNTGYTTYTTTTSDAPSSSPLYSGGSRGYRITASSTVAAGQTLTFSDVNTTGYSNITAAIRIAAFSIGSTGNGMDGTTDQVTIDVSPDGGLNWYSQILFKVTGTGINVRWNFSGSGIGTASYLTTGASTISAYTGSTNQITLSGANAITTLNITGLPSVPNLKLRLSAQCNATSEYWAIDDVKIIGIVTTPTVSVNPTTLTGFTYVVNNGPSSSQTYNLSGSNLTPASGDITITPSTNYEVSLDNTTFSQSAITKSYIGSALSSTPVYVRLKSGLATGDYNNEIIVNSGGGATSKNVTCSGSVTNPPPSITITGTLNDFGSQLINTTSTEQTYSVSGSNLTSDITISPPAGFEISKTTGTGFVNSSSSLTLNQTSGTVSSTTIYVRFAPTVGQTYSGNISHSSSGATTQNVAVSGTGNDPNAPLVVISQVYGGGGNSGSLYRNDFIELYNRGNSPVNLGGWSVQYTSSSGTTWQVTNLTAISLAPGQYYLIQQAQGSAGTTDLPTPDVIGTIEMSATNCKVALCNSTTALSGACPSGGSIMDFIGIGSANCSETSNAPVMSNINAVIRANGGCMDANNNSTDFSTISPPTPRNTSIFRIVCSEPTTQASNVTFSTITTTNMTVSWTNGNGTSRAVFMKEGSGAVTNPADGTNYTASADWSSKGTQLGSSGYYCIYNGTGSSVSLTNLASGTEYYVQVFEYFGSAASSNYFASNGTNNPNSQTTLTPVPAASTYSNSGYWSNTSNWSNGLPGATTNVTINGDVTVDGIVECLDLTISPSGAVRVNTEQNLIVNGNLLVQSDASGTGSFIGASADYYITGTQTVQRYITGNAEAWHLISSPVSGQAISGDWTPTGSYAGGWGYDFYAWDEPSATWLNQKVGANYITSFVPGKGYLVAFLASNPTKTFTGTLNSGNINLPVTVSGSTTFGHANLAGNPYSSSIDWKNNSGFTRSMLKDDDIGEGVGYSLYTWNQSANNYGAYISNSASDFGTNSVNRYVAPMQGFFVVAASAGDFVINNNARVHSAQAWLKSGNDNSFRLKATAPAAYGSDELLLEFGHESSNGGAEKWSSFVAEAPGIYTPKNGKNYSISFLNSVSEHPVIPVSFTAGVEGNYTITADFNTAVFSQVTLHDSKTNTSHNLSTNPVYSFTASPGDNASRFSLHFASVGLGETPTTQPVLAYYHDGALYVSNTEAGAEIMLFGISGQLLKQQTATAGLNTLQAGKLSAGVYVVRVQSAAGTYSSKVIVTR